MLSPACQLESTSTLVALWARRPRRTSFSPLRGCGAGRVAIRVGVSTGQFYPKPAAPFDELEEAVGGLDLLTAAGRYTPLTPSRILDSRFSVGVPGTIPIPADSKIDLVVAGRGGVPTNGVSSVVLNVTAAEAIGVGFVTVWPAGVARPTASSLNVTFVGQNIANLVIVPLGSGGSVSLYAQGATHLVADVAGWFGDSTQPVSFKALFEPLPPTRVLDTRFATGIATTTAVPADTAIVLTVANHGGVPATGFAAVVLNVTAAQATASWFVTVWPSDKPRPTASNLIEMASGQDIANLVSVSVSATGTVSLYSQSGTHLVAASPGTTSGSRSAQPNIREVARQGQRQTS